jgi:hypothetical protein
LFHGLPYSHDNSIITAKGAVIIFECRAIFSPLGENAHGCVINGFAALRIYDSNRKEHGYALANNKEITSNGENN